MLVLSRKINERIMISDDIEITIVSVNGDNVRIGIQAPKDVKILRSEVFEEIQEQNREASLLENQEDREVREKLEEMLHTKILKDKL